MTTSASSHECKEIKEWMNEEYKMKGYHVLCITSIHGNDMNINIIGIQIWSEIYTINPINSFNITIDELNNDFSNFRNLIERNIDNFKYTDKYRLSLPIEHRVQSWSIFTTNGNKMDNYKSLIWFINNIDNNNKILLIYEGGQFVYPGVSINYTRSIIIELSEIEKEYIFESNSECIMDDDNDKIEYKLKTLSLKPLVFSIDDFITNYEEQSLLNLTYKLLHGSQVNNIDYSHWRTSSTAWINFNIRHYVNDMLSYRISKISKLPYEYQENTQVLQYLENQHYGLHLDIFTSTEEVPNEEVFGNKNRLLTVLWYFNDVTDGGWTIFPMYNETWIKKIYNLQSIQHCIDIGGLLIKPKKGKVSLFYNLEPNGETTNYALHGSCPVGKGQKKYAANKWIWNSHQHQYKIDYYNTKNS